MKKEHETDEMRRRMNDRAGDLYLNAIATSTPQSSVSGSVSLASPLTPPPSSLETSSMDLLGPAAYQTASYM